LPKDRFTKIFNSISKERLRNILRVLLFTGFAILIFLRFHDVKHSDDSLDSIVKNKVTIVGKVSDDPEIRNGAPRFSLDVHHIYIQKESLSFIPCEGCTLLVRSKHFGQRILYGDVLQFDAVISKPDKIVSEDGRIFDYQKFLSKNDIYYIADARDLDIVDRGSGNRLVSLLFSIKHKIVYQIDRLLPSPHSFLGSGLIISGKGSMDQEMQMKFQIVGLIHIVVLSGSNVSIIGEAIMRLCSFLPGALSSFLGGFFIVMFAIMTGGDATVVRSTIMSLIALYARKTGRTNDALVSLCLAGMLMIFNNPKILFHDPGFQLSFLASLGLIFYSERLKNFLMFFHTKFRCPLSVLELVSATLSTQIFTLPYIINMSGMFSVVALLVNVVVLPIIPITMLFVFITSVTGFINDTLALLPSFVSWILLSYELYIVDIGASLSWSHRMIPPIPSWSIYMVYAIFLLDVCFAKYRKAHIEKKIPQILS
jgi:competence protein ComEC